MDVNEHLEYSVADQKKLRNDQNAFCNKLFMNIFIQLNIFLTEFSEVNVDDKPLGRITFQVS